jgi:hypothetical protein
MPTGHGGKRKGAGLKSAYSKELRESEVIRVSPLIHKEVKDYAKLRNLPMFVAANELFGEKHNPSEEMITPIEHQAVLGENEQLLDKNKRLQVKADNLEHERDSLELRYKQARGDVIAYKQEFAAMQTQSQSQIDRLYEECQTLRDARLNDSQEIKRLAGEYDVLHKKYVRLEKIKDKPVQKESVVLDGNWEKIEPILKEWEAKIEKAPLKNTRYSHARTFLGAIQNALGLTKEDKI